MRRTKRLFDAWFSPITLMFIPHSRRSMLSVRIPVIAIYAALALAILILAWVADMTSNSAAYHGGRRRLQCRLAEVRSSMVSLRKTEEEFRHTIPFINANTLCDKAIAGNAGQVEDGYGGIDTELVSAEIRSAKLCLASLKSYLDAQRDAFLATPAGLPVFGTVSSPYGPRRDPTTGEIKFHYGIDVCVPTGTPVRATADGLVIFSGKLNGSGNLVAVEHGFGYSTAYAHGSLCVARVGQRVRRGDVLLLSGATGAATGPHVHYQVWRNGKQIDPLSFSQERG
jgi:murein DD-endopeptidase MepM/ murein hydrolase activator NlpD